MKPNGFKPKAYIKCTPNSSTKNPKLKVMDHVMLV